MEEIEKNEKKFILAVDCGSTNIVASIFDLKTNLIAEASNKVLQIVQNHFYITFQYFNPIQHLNIIQTTREFLKLIESLYFQVPNIFVGNGGLEINQDELWDCFVDTIKSVFKSKF